MSNDKMKITGFQLTMLVTGFSQGSILLTSFIADLTKHDTWIVILTGFLISIPFSIVYSLLTKRFSGMNLGQINDIVFGPYAGKAITIFYLANSILLLTYYLRYLGDFYTVLLMTDTPIEFFIIILTSVSAYAVWKGLEVLARISYLIVIIIFSIVISTFLMLLKDMDFTNLLPFFEIPFKNFIQSTHIISVVTFGITFIFFNVMSSLDDTKHIVKNNLLGLLLGTSALFIAVIRNTATLGITSTILNNPSFQSSRLIDLGSIFTRMDIVIGIAQTMLGFFICSIIYYSSVISAAQLFRLRNYKPLILPIGGIAMIGGIIVFNSPLEQVAAGHSVAVIGLIPVMYVLPTITLLIAKIRNCPR